VTVPISFLPGALQTTLTSLSNAVTGGTEGLNNTSVVGGNATIPSILELTSTDSVSSSISVPGNYNALIDTETSDDTIAGNGSSNFLAVFSSNSSVNFATNGGEGSIFASGNADLGVSGSAWSIIGGSGGNLSINTDSASTYVTLSGAGNAVGSYSQVLNVLAGGSNDFIQTGTQNTPSSDVVSVTGFADIRNLGAADTVYATGAGSFIGSFGAQGGSIYFINEGTAASSIIGGINLSTGLLTSPGSVTVQAGAGGGVYDGGTNGNNSLIGGSGLVTLFSAGTDNYLYANGSSSGAGYNLLNAASGSNDTLVAGTGSTNNIFFAGTGTESISSFGKGVQTYFVGTLGSETISGSSVSGATNDFVFNQAASAGGGTDLIKNWGASGTADYAVINNGDNITGVTIQDIVSLSGANSGTQIDLTDGTTIKIIGVNVDSFSQSLVGGTHF